MNWKLQMIIVFVFTVLNCMITQGVNENSQKDKTYKITDSLKEAIGDINIPEESTPASVIDAFKEVVRSTPEAMYELGRVYFEGLDNMTRDVPKALELLQKSAELGNSNAMLELAYIYQKGDGIDRDQDQAVAWLRKAAEAGKGIAMLALAVTVSEGQNPYIYDEQCIEWARKGLKSLEEAAGKEDCDAMRILGMIYQPAKVMDLGSVTDSVTWFSMHLLREQSPGINKNEGKSTEWYSKAAAGYEKKATAGNSEAMYWLGRMYEWGLGVKQDFTEGLSWYQKAADAGHSGGMVELGWACHKTEDFENAFKWFNKAAEQGNSEAMVSLGWLYSKGQGVSKDKLEAIKWWRKAADRGHPKAMLSLGAAYANREGVMRDYQQAFMWYKKGADAGDSTCMFSLGLMYVAGRGIASDPNKAIECWSKGAEKQHDGCMANLGWLYLYGEGVQQDPDQAIHWLQKAANLGNEYAKKRLVEISQNR